MAQQDKQDFYWNGMLAGAINNLYYDLINVDVVHVPYATTHRNSSFFLKTRPWYVSSESWNEWGATSWRDAVDVKIIWDEKCNQEEWTAYVLWKKWNNKKFNYISIKCFIRKWKRRSKSLGRRNITLWTYINFKTKWRNKNCRKINS